eukprot:718050_1
MQSRFLLDVIITQRTTIFQLFACKNQSLLLRRNTFLILDLCLHILNGFLLNVIIRQCASVFQLFACKNETLLLWWDAFFILDLCLHVLNGVIGFDIQCNGVSLGSTSNVMV